MAIRQTKPLKAVIKNGKPTSVNEYGANDVVPIANGGTGANNIDDILKNIGAAPLNHTHTNLPGGGGGRNTVRVYEENPSGAYNKQNVDYRTAYPFVASSVELYLNGLRQRSGEDNDFILIAPNIIRMMDSPYNGDLLTVSYDILTDEA